ncbi:hypothetical protein FGRMN_7127 [Fusarium graminum]|nr:hypothetical protein FGRMN_7127 [Fusarium graminum]
MDRSCHSSHQSGSSSQDRDYLLQRQDRENFASYEDSEWNAPQNNEGYLASGSYSDHPGNFQQDEFSSDQSYDSQYLDNQYYDPLSYNNQYHPQASFIPSANDQSFWQYGSSGFRAYADDLSTSFGQGTVPLSYGAPVASTQDYNSQPVQELRGFLLSDTEPSVAQATASRGQEVFDLNPARCTSQASTSSNPRIHHGSNSFASVVAAEPARERRGPDRSRGCGNKGRASPKSTYLPVYPYPFASRMSMERSFQEQSFESQTNNQLRRKYQSSEEGLYLEALFCVNCRRENEEISIRCNSCKRNPLDRKPNNKHCIVCRDLVSDHRSIMCNYHVHEKETGFSPEQRWVLEKEGVCKQCNKSMRSYPSSLCTWCRFGIPHPL